MTTWRRGSLAAVLGLLLTPADAGHLRQRVARAGSSATALGPQQPLTVALPVTGNEAPADYSIRLSNFANVQYSGPVTIGKQTLQAVYDTGSFEILVLSTLCTLCSPELQMYDSAQSKSYAPGAVEAEHRFASGDVITAEGFESVRAGPVDSPFVANSMPFWQIVRHHFKFWQRRAGFSGIVGLPHKSHIPEGYAGDPRQDEPLLAKLGLTSFAMCLERGPQDSPGWLHLGRDLEHGNTAFQSARVLGMVHWATRMTQLRNGDELTSYCNPSCGAVVDSGTSLISAPPSARPFVDSLKQLVRADCSNFAELPMIKFRLDNVEIQLPPQAYVLRTGPNKECKVHFMEIDKKSQLGDVWILGMPFLRHYYTIFDRVNKQMHFAATAPDCQVASSVPQTALSNSSGIAGFHSGGLSRFAASDLVPLTANLTAARGPTWADFDDGATHMTL